MRSQRCVSRSGRQLPGDCAGTWLGRVRSHACLSRAGAALCAEDPEFERQYQELVAQARAAAEQPEASVNRRWLPCDVQVVRAWIRGQHAYEGESWRAFRERVIGCRLRLDPTERDANIVVFTSATPIGIWTALAMEIHDERAMRLAGVLHNTSCTVMRLHDGDLRLHSFNAIPHLSEPGLRTYR